MVESAMISLSFVPFSLLPEREKVLSESCFLLPNHGFYAKNRLENRLEVKIPVSCLFFDANMVENKLENSLENRCFGALTG